MNLERFGERIADMQVKNSGLFMLVLLILIVVVAPGLPMLIGNIEPSLEKILPQDVEEVKTMNNMRSQFGADMMYIIATADGPAYDVRDPDVVKYLDILTSKLREDDYIIEATSIADIIKSANNGVIPESNSQIRELMLLNPRTPSFVNHDYSKAIIEIRSDTGSSASITKDVVNSLNSDISSVEEYNPGLELQITGFNAIDKATFEVIISDFAYITIFTFIFMLAFLLIYFGGSIAKVFATISVVMISVIITLGLTGYLGITVTVVTMVAAAMIMALGISYGINVTYDYYLFRKENDKEESIKKLNSSLIRALIGSSLTTSAGFLALLFGIIPAMKNLGIVLAMGISITLVVSIFFLPVILYRLDRGNEKQT